MSGGLLELAIVILFAASLGVVAKFFRQPIILAYLAAGILIGYFGFFNLSDKETFQIFSDLGIMFLLFLVGLEINYNSLRLVGKTSLIVGLGQVIFTFFFGFLIALALGFPKLHAVYIAITLTFSSTIIIVKLLSDKRDLNSLYGKISVGLLLVQDFIAILILIFLTGIGSGETFIVPKIVLTIVLGIFLFALMIWLGRRIFPFIFNKIAHSQELLFLTSLAWLFALSALVSKLGFSIEIAGFLAGLALANSSEHLEITSRMRALRDFFILIFFVILGSSIVLSDFSGIILPVVIFSLFVLIGNPLIVLIIMGFMGFRKRTSFFTGLVVAQISEFSLIVAALGLKLGQITNEVVALITAVGIITITTSTYLIIHSHRIFSYLSDHLSIFERKTIIMEDGFMEKEFQKPIVLVGLGRTGESIITSLRKDKLLVVDFDPEIISRLKERGIDYIFGDISDPDIFEKANLEKAQLVISTTPYFESNLSLLNQVNLLKKKPKIILRAETEREAEFLYRRGADYVLLPNLTSGQYLGKNIAFDPRMGVLNQLRARDLLLIRRIKDNKQEIAARF